ELQRKKYWRNQRDRPAHTPPSLSNSQMDAASSRRRPASIIEKSGDVLHSVGPWTGGGISATAKRPARASSRLAIGAELCSSASSSSGLARAPISSAALRRA